MRVIVFGSIIMDMVATCQRHPQVGETIIGKELAYFPGGKGANQAIASAKAGAETQLIGAVAPDAFGKTLISFIADQKVDITNVASLPNNVTGAAVIIVNEQGENSIVVLPGSNSKATANPIIEQLDGPAVALSQFEVPLPEIERLFNKVVKLGGITILNPSPYQFVSPSLLKECSYLIVNETEFAQLLNGKVPKNAIDVRAHLSASTLANDIIVTLGAGGFVMRYNNEFLEAEGHQVTALDSTGAGDCFAGSFAAGLAQGQSPIDAAIYANAAAALSVTKAGAGPSMPNPADVKKILNV